jgi:hypothetical protein
MSPDRPCHMSDSCSSQLATQSTAAAHDTHNVYVTFCIPSVINLC